MADVINFDNKKKNLNQTDIDLIVHQLRKIKPEMINSIFINLGLEDAAGERSTFTLVKGLDFHDLGFIDSYIQSLKLDILNEHIVTDTESRKELDKYLKSEDFFEKDPEEE